MQLPWRSVTSPLRRLGIRLLARRGMTSLMFGVAFNFLCFLLIFCIYMYSRVDQGESVKLSLDFPGFPGVRPIVVDTTPPPTVVRYPQGWDRVDKAGLQNVDNCDNLTYPGVVKETYVWYPLEDDAVDTYVFSAYLDNRLHPQVVKILGISSDVGFAMEGMQRHQAVKYCQLWYRDRRKPTIARAQYDIVPETHDLEYAPSFHMCIVPEGMDYPYAVSLVRRRCAKASHFLPVRQPLTTPPDVDFTVCISPLNFHYDDVDSFVEIIELNRILGARKIVLYNHTCGSRMNHYLKSYVKEGLIDVIPWRVPVRVHVRPPDPLVVPQVHYFGQVVALNECLYRYMYRSKYIVFSDLDEVIMPRKAITWSGMMASFHGNHTDEWSHRRFLSGAFLFQNTFFRIDWPDVVPFKIPDASALKLRTLLKTTRESKIWTHYMRSKYIVIPKVVEVMGIHFVFNFIQRHYGHQEVPSSDALLHHYRDWGDEEQIDKVQDPYVVDVFGQKLIASVKRVHAKVGVIGS